MVRTRNAILPDVEQIHAIIRAYSGNGTLLPERWRSCGKRADFVVAETMARCGLWPPCIFTACTWPKSFPFAVTLRLKAMAQTQAGGSASEGSQAARSHMRLPLHAHPGILATWDSAGQTRRPPGQDLQRLRALPRVQRVPTKSPCIARDSSTTERATCRSPNRWLS